MLSGNQGCIFCHVGNTPAVRFLASQDSTPIGWFLLAIVTSAEESRTDRAVLSLAAALKARGDRSSKSLEVVLLGASVPGSGPAGPGAAVWNALVGLQEVKLQPGGRHDNDHADYRSIAIMITSEEVRGRGPHRHAHVLHWQDG